jgi:uncharacterized LabA/DUF88 family protein
MGYAPAPTPVYRSMMVFIDGGYLRKNIRDLVGNDEIDFRAFLNWIAPTKGRIEAELIRIYYYDAIVDIKDSNYEKQNAYFDDINKLDSYEVKLGRLIKTNNDYRQKGVDILLAIDMLSKAFLNHFEWGVLLAGDDDYVDLVKMIKNIAGKQVIGVYFERNASERLVNNFDTCIVLNKDILIKSNCIREK